MVSTVLEEVLNVIESNSDAWDHPVRSEIRANVLLISDSNPDAVMLCSSLSEAGHTCDIVPYSDVLIEALGEYLIDLLIIDVECLAETIAEGLKIARKLKSKLEMPVIALVSENCLSDFNVAMGIDDFATKPCSAAETNVRIRQVLWRAKDIDEDNLIKYGDLVIDMDKYEVTVAGKLIPLSFKEYELLKILATNKDRVLTREALLDKVWGYDYFGGDRTVDVHIRRLRSKIEDAGHSFIETVRNVGYKFKTGM